MLERHQTFVTSPEGRTLLRCLADDPDLLQKIADDPGAALARMGISIDLYSARALAANLRSRQQADNRVSQGPIAGGGVFAQDSPTVIVLPPLPPETPDKPQPPMVVILPPLLPQDPGKPQPPMVVVVPPPPPPHDGD